MSFSLGALSKLVCCSDPTVHVRSARPWEELVGVVGYGTLEKKLAGPRWYAPGNVWQTMVLKALDVV